MQDSLRLFMWFSRKIFLRATIYEFVKNDEDKNLSSLIARNIAMQNQLESYQLVVLSSACSLKNMRTRIRADYLTVSCKIVLVFIPDLIQPGTRQLTSGTDCLLEELGST